MQRQTSFACIAGAPRCGTTSLAGFLQVHPEICFSSVKEPHFFTQHDLAQVSERELHRFVEAEYLDRFFARRSGHHALIAEGSVSYLYAPERMEAVLRVWPDARFIIALRDPMEMLPSLHRRLLFNGDETVSDFEQAWALTKERKQGRAIPRSCIDARALQYDVLGQLGSHLARFFHAVGRERCFVALFDDLSADPMGLYWQLMAFLGLSSKSLPDFAPRRASRGYRIGCLQRLLKRPPVASRGILAGEKFRQRVKSLDRDPSYAILLKTVFAARKQLLRWNSVPPPPVRLSDSLRREIHDQFEGDVALLSELIGRDLSHWLDRAPKKRQTRQERLVREDPVLA